MNSSWPKVITNYNNYNSNPGTTSYNNQKRLMGEESRKESMARLYTLEGSWDEEGWDKFSRGIMLSKSTSFNTHFSLPMILGETELVLANKLPEPGECKKITPHGSC